jgi:hypothetical protein
MNNVSFISIKKIRKMSYKNYNYKYTEKDILNSIIRLETILSSINLSIKRLNTSKIKDNLILKYKNISFHCEKLKAIYNYYYLENISDINKYY